MFLTLEPTYGELHGYLYKSDEQKQAEAQWQAGFNAYIDGDNYSFTATPAWQDGYKESWYEQNSIAGSANDPNGIYTDIAWQGFLELGGKA